jgi:hypothetical protein
MQSQRFCNKDYYTKEFLNPHNIKLASQKSSILLNEFKGYKIKYQGLSLEDI